MLALIYESARKTALLLGDRHGLNAGVTLEMRYRMLLLLFYVGNVSCVCARAEAFGTTTWSKQYCSYEKSSRLLSLTPYNQINVKTVSEPSYIFLLRAAVLL